MGSSVPSARLCPILLGLAAVLLPAVCAAQTKPDAPAALTAKQQEQLEQAARLEKQALLLIRAGKLTEAVKAAEERVAIERAVRGPTHEAVAAALNFLARLHVVRDDFAAARKAYQEVEAIRVKLRGEKHWQVAETRQALAHVERLAQVTPADRSRLAGAEQLGQFVKALTQQGRAEEALPLALMAWDVFMELLGEKDSETAQGLYDVAAQYHAVAQSSSARSMDRRLEQFQLAERGYRRSLQVQKELLGDEHPICRKGLDSLARVIAQLATLHVARNDLTAARQACQEVLDLQTRRRGPKHWQTAQARWALMHVEALARLKPDQRERLKKTDEQYAQAEGLLQRGKSDEALQAAQQALAARKELLGNKHPDVAIGLNTLAGFYLVRGEFGPAEENARQAWAIFKEAGGEEHPQAAITLTYLGMLDQERCDYSRAEGRFRQALLIFENAQRNEGSLDQYLGGLHNLGRLYTAMTAYDRAERMLWKGLSLWNDSQRPEDAHYAAGLHSLATVYLAWGDYARAEPFLSRARQVRCQALGDWHPDTGLNQVNLGALYLARGNNLQAEAELRKGLLVLKESLGDDHPCYAWALQQQALWHFAQADYARAEPLIRQALAIYRKHLELAASGPSERHYLALARSLRESVEIYLGLASRLSLPPEQTYAEVLACKGALFARQRRARLARTFQGSEAARRWSEWHTTTGQLSYLAAAVPDPSQVKAWRQRLRELTTRRERLAEELTGSCPEFQHEQALFTRAPAQIQKALAAGTALIDLIEYTQFTPALNGKEAKQRARHLMAFVTRHDRPVVQVDLGALAAVADAIDRWRSAVAANPPRADRPEVDAGIELHLRIWQPLQSLLAGVRAVLISPDGALARLPWTALPGTRPGSYLIEDLSIAIVPVPLLRTGGEKRSRSPAALLVGVGASGVGTVPTEKPRAPVQPPSVSQEIVAVGDEFARTHAGHTSSSLTGAEATRAALQKQAPGKTHLHLAVPSFQTAAELESALNGNPARPVVPLRTGQLGGPGALIGFHPGLLSGLTVTGSRTGTEPITLPALPAADGPDDGVWTALEVAGTDLSAVEWVVLSGSATGIKDGGGEGTLGLQHAFQVAGARRLVSGLWRPEPQVSQQLLTEFYANLWQKQLAPLEALRQAQLNILRAGAPEGAHTERADPRLWAAWMVSGDLEDLTLGPATPAVIETASESRGWLPYALGGLVLLALLVWLVRYVPQHWLRRSSLWNR